jgi:hypothetical protein
MELEDIFLARFAELGPDGLFTAVGGGLNRINAGRFPWSWGFLFLLARYRLSLEEAQRRHTLAIEREFPGGQVESISPEFPMVQLATPAETGPDGRVGFGLSYCLVNLIFPQAGVYKYRLKIDGQRIGEAKLLVAGPPQQE